jgi:5-formyltetrahydrofolate cyclo-ligase
MCHGPRRICWSGSGPPGGASSQATCRSGPRSTPSRDGALHGAGARVCVPVIAGAGQPLDFREWLPGCAMVEGPFKALVPERGDWLTPDALIVPLVGFDRALNRLGYGGGFYDRTLARLRGLGRGHRLCLRGAGVARYTG